MHFSCKISNSVLSYLENNGEDISPIFDQGNLPFELLRDPSAWLSAPDMESFLEVVVRNHWSHLTGNLFESAGHAGPTNYAWGVLDSVLKMMPRPEEVFHQPEKFLAYFLSPEPPVENLKFSESNVEFDLPLPAEQYPCVSEYLKAAFEAIPTYSGRSLATVQWNSIHISMVFTDVHHAGFNEQWSHQVSPDLLKGVMVDHQRLQREIEDRNLELARKEDELNSLRRDLQQARAGEVPNGISGIGHLAELQFADEAPGYVIGQNLARLHDYMVRAQQLITMLAAQGKMTPAVKEAMRRVDWDFVKERYPRTISESVESLRKLQIQLQKNESVSYRPEEKNV